MTDTPSSFQWSKFTSGEWSKLAQGDTDNPAYKSALNQSLNGQPIEEGPWVRRSGFRYLGDPVFGAPGVVREFNLPNGEKAILELTYDDTYGSNLRFWTQHFNGMTADDYTILCDNFTQIEYISNTNPAYIILASVPPACMNGSSTWQTGDTIKIYIDPSVALINGAGYVNREFAIQPGEFSTKWFLMDATSGDWIDGTGTGMAVGDIGRSYAAHVVRFPIPYMSLNEVRRVRVVQTGQKAFLLSQISRPVLLQQVSPAPANAPNSGAIWFSVGEAEFIDGPYLDCLPGSSQAGTSLGYISTIDGSGNCTFFISDGAYWFQPSDVNRKIRLWCQPQPFVQGTTYAAGSRVTYLGSFFAAASSTSSIPLTDATWYAVPEAGRWGFGKITAINVGGNPYMCSLTLTNPTGPGGGLDNGTVTANGATPAGVAGIDAVCDSWQIGVYTTNQHPSCGAFYQGRLWLGGAVPNRLDGGMSNGGSLAGFMTIPVADNPITAPSNASFGGLAVQEFVAVQTAIGSPSWGTSQIASGALGSPPMPGQTVETNMVYFSPTNAAGEPLGNSGVALVMNAPEQDQINFMHPNADGLILGSIGGEHVLSAAEGGVITPSSAVISEISAYGSAFVEPIRVGNALLFVQKYGQLVIEYIVDFFSRHFIGRNLNIYAKHITSPGVTEIAYQEETTPTLWCAMADGSLGSCVYRRVSSFATEPPTMMGWSRHTVPDAQHVMSLCMGADRDGTLDQLVMLTTDEPIPTLEPISGVPISLGPAPPIPTAPPLPPPPPPPPPVSPVSPPVSPSGCCSGGDSCGGCSGDCSGDSSGCSGDGDGGCGGV